MYKVKSTKELDQKSKIGKIWLLVYCEDVKKQHFSDVLSSTGSYSDDQEDMDNLYMSSTDEELRSLSKEEIQKIRNMDLVQRIGALGEDMYDKLSQPQRVAYAKYAKRYHWLSEDDVPEVLAQIKNCTRLRSLYFRDEDKDLSVKYNLTDADLLEIVHSIELSDFNELTSQLSYHDEYYGDQVLIFNVDGIQLPNGIDLSMLKIYIKINYSLSKNSSIAYFSIHES